MSKISGLLWAGLFYVLVVGVAMVGAGTVLATFGWSTL
jgi:hypothetical protein